MHETPRDIGLYDKRCRWFLVPLLIMPLLTANVHVIGLLDSLTFTVLVPFLLCMLAETFYPGLV
jgi:predicted Na+-dependent transporter